MAQQPNMLREMFAQFLEAPSREGLREIIKNEHGEFSSLEFKEKWPEPYKTAKNILGLANSGGGCIVFGLQEGTDGVIDVCGMTAFIDKADIEKSIRKFLPQSLLENYNVLNFSYDSSEYQKLIGKKFQVLWVPDDPSRLPFLAIADSEGLKKTVIYVRRQASTEEATHDEIQSLINRRLDTGHSTEKEIGLDKHLNDLKSLYSYYDRYRFFDPLGRSSTLLPYWAIESGASSVREDFGTFLGRMIILKRKQIEETIFD